MNVIHQLMAYAGPFLLFAVVVVLLYKPTREQTLGLTAALFAVYFVVALLPIGGISVIGYVRVVTGDLSITTLALLINALLARMLADPPLDDPSRRLVLIAVALTALAFYPLALGLSPFDPYRLGYAPVVLGAALLGLSLWAWFAGYRAAAMFILVPVAAYDLQLLESTNLWDYLLDPWVSFYAWGWIVYSGIQRWRRRSKVAPQQSST